MAPVNAHRYKKPIAAFSLIESIVALVLVLLVFFISIHFFVSVKESGFSMQRMSAASTLEEYIQASFLHKDFSVKKEVVNNWTVSRESSPDAKEAALLQVRFTVYKRDSLGAPFLTRTFLVGSQTASESFPDAQP
ncbi:hypothetical protein LQ567_16835 [Niabella pedocola]|uniref:Prepilin-type N-terminal cleavage/methylation domain-containing protein n=1 Tax=Niabella pedocola TaxID=1752077 RepID=A0ABS8PVX9_9BACT|nr:hypothetical protein [Niabella pedocola]MCD2424448.1 hypothetical protein [Niabella pedocola]